MSWSHAAATRYGPSSGGECRTDALGLLSDPADVLPAGSEVRQQRGGVLLGPGRQGVGFHAGTLSAGAGLRKVEQPFQQLSRVAGLRVLEVRVGAECRPAAVHVAGSSGDRADVDAGCDQVGDHEVP
jgi:hypothetical protein